MCVQQWRFIVAFAAFSRLSRSNLEGDVAASSGGKFPPNFAINYKPETQSGRIFRRQSDPASGLSVGN
jgi:hypothetical protein